MRNKILNYQFSIFNINISPKQIFSHPMFAGSAVMVFGSNIANFFASIYHFVLGRMLNPDQYGELAATITFISLAITSLSFLSIVIVKFISSSKSKSQWQIIGWFSSNSLYVGLVATLLLILVAPFTSKFFHIHQNIMLIAAPIIGIFVVSMTLKAVLQGLLMFSANVISTNIQMITRLLLGVFAVYIGWGVEGALVGFLLAVLLESITIIYYLRKHSIFNFSNNLKNRLKIFKYAIPTLFSTLSVNSLISTDVLLVKHHLSSYDAGIYASLSTLGKIIFFGTAPIISVMFPLIAKKHSEKKSHTSILLVSIVMTFLVCMAVTAVYVLFPETMINILFGAKYIVAANLLYLFGLFISIYTIGTLLLNYYLSRDNTKVVVIAIFAAIVQYILIQMYNESILQVVTMSIISTSLMTVGLIIFFVYEKYWLLRR